VKLGIYVCLLFSFLYDSMTTGFRVLDNSMSTAPQFMKLFSGVPVDRPGEANCLCLLCGILLTYKQRKGGAANLRKHLLSKHSEVSEAQACLFPFACYKAQACLFPCSVLHEQQLHTRSSVNDYDFTIDSSRSVAGIQICRGARGRRGPLRG
jgi:hypothetical protein